MASTGKGALLTDQHRRRQVSLAITADSQARRAWDATLDLNDLTGTQPIWKRTMLNLIQTWWRISEQAALAYLPQYREAETGEGPGIEIGVQQFDRRRAGEKLDWLGSTNVKWHSPPETPRTPTARHANCSSASSTRPCSPEAAPPSNTGRNRTRAPSDGGACPTATPARSAQCSSRAAPSTPAQRKPACAPATARNTTPLRVHRRGRLRRLGTHPAGTAVDRRILQGRRKPARTNPAHRAGHPADHAPQRRVQGLPIDTRNQNGARRPSGRTVRQEDRRAPRQDAEPHPARRRRRQTRRPPVRHRSRRENRIPAAMGRTANRHGHQPDHQNTRLAYRRSRF